MMDFELLRAGIKERDEKVARLRTELRALQDILVEHDKAQLTMAKDIRAQVFESLGIDQSSPEATSADIAAIIQLFAKRRASP